METKGRRKKKRITQPQLVKIKINEFIKRDKRKGPGLNNGIKEDISEDLKKKPKQENKRQMREQPKERRQK